MELDDLYDLPLERFVPERGALAKQLRSDGHRDEAAAAAKLRKPSAAAWAVNQLVRGQKGAVSELLHAGDAVRGAQENLLAGGGDGRALRDAGARERDAVDALVERARGLLTDGGHELSATTLQRLADTLHAAALDEDARAAVVEGRLERELRHVGLGLAEGAAVFAPDSATSPAAAKKPKPAAKRTSADAAAERRAAKERAAAEAAEKAEREAVRKQARAVVAKAAKREERAGHVARAAEDRRQRAAQALEGGGGAERGAVEGRRRRGGAPARAGRARRELGLRRFLHR